MIVADRKPLDEILNSIKDYEKIMLMGCGGCVTICFSGGAKAVELLASQIKIARKKQGNEIEIIDFEHPESLHSPIFLNCFEREEIKIVKDDPTKDEPTKEDAISHVYSHIMPGEPITIESAEKDLNSMFFMPRRYNLGRVGRYKLNKKFNYSDTSTVF